MTKNTLKDQVTKYSKKIGKNAHDWVVEKMHPGGAASPLSKEGLREIFVPDEALGMIDGLVEQVGDLVSGGLAVSGKKDAAQKTKEITKTVREKIPNNKESVGSKVGNFVGNWVSPSATLGVATKSGKAAKALNIARHAIESGLVAAGKGNPKNAKKNFAVHGGTSAILGSLPHPKKGTAKHLRKMREQEIEHLQNKYPHTPPSQLEWILNENIRKNKAFYGDKTPTNLVVQEGRANVSNKDAIDAFDRSNSYSASEVLRMKDKPNKKIVANEFVKDIENPKNNFSKLKVETEKKYDQLGLKRMGINPRSENLEVFGDALEEAIRNKYTLPSLLYSGSAMTQKEKDFLAKAIRQGDSLPSSISLDALNNFQKKVGKSVAGMVKNGTDPIVLVDLQAQAKNLLHSSLDEKKRKGLTKANRFWKENIDPFDNKKIQELGSRAKRGAKEEDLFPTDFLLSANSDDEFSKVIKKMSPEGQVALLNDFVLENGDSTARHAARTFNLKKLPHFLKENKMAEKVLSPKAFEHLKKLKFLSEKNPELTTLQSQFSKNIGSREAVKNLAGKNEMMAHASLATGGSPISSTIYTGLRGAKALQRLKDKHKNNPKNLNYFLDPSFRQKIDRIERENLNLQKAHKVITSKNKKNDKKGSK